MPNLPATLKEFHRALKPTGTLYVSLITAPLEAALPKRTSTHLPTLLRSRDKVLDQFQSSGFEVSRLETQRFAYWFEATPRP